MNRDRFLEFCNLVLGTLTGVLICIPFGLSSGNLIFIFLGLILGFIIAYRRRKSRAFLYFCISAILVLSGLIGKNIQNFTN